MLVSVIIPCFNEEKVLGETHTRVSRVMSQLKGKEYEILYVDDGSVDQTANLLSGLAAHDSHVHVVRFSRNFGHQAAVSAGLRFCRGDLAVILDADLQDPPEVVPSMIEQLERTGSNGVYGVRETRKGETIFKRATARLFYLLLNRLSETSIPVNTGDFRVIDRKLIDAFNALPENNKYIRGLMGWLGFEQTPFYYQREARYAGDSKYTLRKMLRFASTGIFYFSKKPLQMATGFGFFSVAAGLLLTGWLLLNKILNPQYLVSGWTSIVLVVVYFGGVQLLTIGILGHYIGSLFDEVKKRPEYVVDQMSSGDRESQLVSISENRVSSLLRTPSVFIPREVNCDVNQPKGAKVQQQDVAEVKG